MRPFAVPSALASTAAFAASGMAAMGVAVISVAVGSQPVRAGALFAAVDLPQERFVLVAAPIGDGSKQQLNIYEQLNGKRPCFAMSGALPAKVDPMLATFDFTGICNRFIDANGYSLRIGDTDLATTYRLSVIRKDNDNMLVAIPTKAGAGPEMVVARTQGDGTGFMQLVFEPGWQLKRRAFGGRQLGHVYIYRQTAPGDSVTSTVIPAPAATGTPAATAPSTPAATPASRATGTTAATPAATPAAIPASTAAATTTKAPLAPVAPPSPTGAKR